MKNYYQNIFRINRLVWQNQPQAAPEGPEVQAQKKESKGPNTVDELRAAGEAAIKAQQDWLDALQKQSDTAREAAKAADASAEASARSADAWEDAAYASKKLDRISNPLNWIADQFTGGLPEHRAKKGLGRLASRIARNSQPKSE